MNWNSIKTRVANVRGILVPKVHRVLFLMPLESIQYLRHVIQLMSLYLRPWAKNFKFFALILPVSRDNCTDLYKVPIGRIWILIKLKDCTKMEDKLVR